MSWTGQQFSGNGVYWNSVRSRLKWPSPEMALRKCYQSFLACWQCGGTLSRCLLSRLLSLTISCRQTLDYLTMLGTSCIWASWSIINRLTSSTHSIFIGFPGYWWPFDEADEQTAHQTLCYNNPLQMVSSRVWASGSNESHWNKIRTLCLHEIERNGLAKVSLPKAGAARQQV